MLDYFFSAALPDFFKEQSTRCRSVIKGYLKKDNTFTKEDMLQGVARCTKSPASSEHRHRSKMNLKNKSTNSYKKVLCVIITVFPHGASGHYSPRVTWLLVLSSLMPQIHLVDHIIPSFRKWLTPPESLHILTTVLSFLMAAGAWNEVRFPDSGMRCSAMTTGKKHRPWLLPGQLDHGSWCDPTVCTTEVAALLHAMLYFSDSWPKQLHFLGSERSLSSPLHPIPPLKWVSLPGTCQFSPLKLDPILKLSRHKFSPLPISWVLSHLLNTLLA